MQRFMLTVTWTPLTPDRTARCPILQYLNLKDNIMAEMPSTMHKLSGLKLLDLSGNGMSYLAIRPLTEAADPALVAEWQVDTLSFFSYHWKGNVLSFCEHLSWFTSGWPQVKTDPNDSGSKIYYNFRTKESRKGKPAILKLVQLAQTEQVAVSAARIYRLFLVCFDFICALLRHLGIDSRRLTWRNCWVQWAPSSPQRSGDNRPQHNSVYRIAYYQTRLALSRVSLSLKQWSISKRAPFITTTTSTVQLKYDPFVHYFEFFLIILWCT
jgi:hypothetical protein